jgi:hypothetical protein
LQADQGYRHGSGNSASGKRQHPPQSYETPGAFVASHSGLHRPRKRELKLIFAYINLARKQTPNRLLRYNRPNFKTFWLSGSRRGFCRIMPLAANGSDVALCARGWLILLRLRPPAGLRSE